MKGWKLFSIGATEITLHPSVLLYGLYALLTGHLRFTLLAVASIVIHEAAHASVSAILGKPPSCIELSPLGAAMYLEEENLLPRWKRCFTLIAGPAVTILLCVIALHLTREGHTARETGYMLFMANLSIIAINLLPVLPLDGGRLLTLVLDSFLPQNYVRNILRLLGTVCGIGLIVLNIICSYKLGGWNFSLAFAGCCIWYSAYAATTTRALREMRYFLDRKIMLERKGTVPTKCVTALHTLPVRMLIRTLPAQKYIDVLCVEAGTLQPLVRLSEAELIQEYLSHPDATVGSCTRHRAGKNGC